MKTKKYTGLKNLEPKKNLNHNIDHEMTVTNRNRETFTTQHDIMQQKINNRWEPLRRQQELEVIGTTSKYSDPLLPSLKQHNLSLVMVARLQLSKLPDFPQLFPDKNQFALTR